MFYDQVKIQVIAGAGGNGAMTFRREKYVPYGGPSGGDGGKGGDVILEVDTHYNTLYHFAHRVEFKAADGERGGNKEMTGASGSDLVVPVPPGTLVIDDEQGTLLADLTEPGQRVVVASGGRGGRGNMRFATPTNKAPRIAEKGDPGTTLWLRLELKLLADVGLVGKPNAGKSTLLSVTSSAKPKIAPYPFTTLQPNLGVVALDYDRTFVMADLPGLIEGASDGKGLGLEFLRHIERTRLIVHLLDGASVDPIGDFIAINHELETFGHDLVEKPQIVAINKIDIPGVKEIIPDLTAELNEAGYSEVVAISAATHENVRTLLERIYQSLQDAPEPTLSHLRPVAIRPQFVDTDQIAVVRDTDGAWRVTGGKVVKAVNRTRTEYQESLLRLHGYLERQGVLDALRTAGVVEGDVVRIGEYEFEWREENYE